MKKFQTLQGIAAVLSDINIDTDAIIPKQFLKTIHREGLGKNLFYEKRYLQNYDEDSNFILNKDIWRESKIIIAGDNFGCGSSREHAPWALLDFGIECIISTSFADIFYNNSIKNSLLPIILKKNDINVLTDFAFKKEMFTINLKEELISVRDINIRFNIDKIVKNRLINGYDDIELTLKNENLIKRYERNKNKFFERNGQLVNLGDTHLSYSPSLVTAEQLTYTREGWSISLTNKFVGEQYMGNINAELSKLESYSVQDILVQAVLVEKEKGPSLDLNFHIYNILNERYSSNGYFYTFDDNWTTPGMITTIEGVGYYPQAGRHFLAGLTLKF